MFKVNEDLSIFVTRGDIGVLGIGGVSEDNVAYTFKANDILRLRVFEKKNHSNIVLSKDTVVTEESSIVDISLTSEDTKIGEIINKPVDYWYEVELNPETAPQTMIGYDEDGPKIFRLYPEGADA